MNTVSSFWFLKHEPVWLAHYLSDWMIHENQYRTVTEWHAYQVLLKRWFYQRQDMARLRDQDYG